MTGRARRAGDGAADRPAPADAPTGAPHDAARPSAFRGTGGPQPRAAPAPQPWEDAPLPLAAPYAAAFYDRDPRRVARDLLGAVLECRTPEGIAAGVVVETEAYLGPADPSCHAVVGRTARTWHLHGPPGTAYVYRIYGMHWCVNAVTRREGIGSAVLVRALAPREGLTLMRARRGDPADDRALCSGPGKLCAALALDGRLDGAPLDGTPMADGRAVVLRPGFVVPDAGVLVTPRIGITRAADWPLRYLVRDHPHASRTPGAFFRRPYADGVDAVPPEALAPFDDAMHRVG